MTTTLLPARRAGELIECSVWLDTRSMSAPTLRAAVALTKIHVREEFEAEEKRHNGKIRLLEIEWLNEQRWRFTGIFETARVAG